MRLIGPFALSISRSLSSLHPANSKRKCSIFSAVSSTDSTSGMPSDAVNNCHTITHPPNSPPGVRTISPSPSSCKRQKRFGHRFEVLCGKKGEYVTASCVHMKEALAPAGEDLLSAAISSRKPGNTTSIDQVSSNVTASIREHLQPQACSRYTVLGSCCLECAPPPPGYSERCRRASTKQRFLASITHSTYAGRRLEVSLQPCVLASFRHRPPRRPEPRRTSAVCEESRILLPGTVHESRCHEPCRS